jgi:hypothetical protein
MSDAIKYIPFGMLLALNRSSFIVSLLRDRPADWLQRRVRTDYERNICLIIAGLVSSRDPRYSEKLLHCLRILPHDILEQHPSLRRYFLNPRMHTDSVEEAIKTCQEAIRLCFSTK